MRVMLVEDHIVIREAIAGFLARAGLDVVGQAQTAVEALDLVERATPDIALLDLHLAGDKVASGLDLAETLNKHKSKIALLVLSEFPYPAYIDRLLSLRDSRIGYLLKSSAGGLDNLIDAVHRVSTGETYVDPVLVRQLMRTKRTPDHPMASLTPRERDVFALVAQGRTNAGLAEDLGIGIHTAVHHVSSIFAKLGLGQAVDSENHGYNVRVLAVLNYLSYVGPGAIPRADNA